MFSSTNEAWVDLLSIIPKAESGWNQIPEGNHRCENNSHKIFYVYIFMNSLL